MENELVVDAIMEMESPKDIHWVMENVRNNGYVSHETKFQDLLVVTTENGTIAVKSKNPTFIFGLIVNLSKEKHKELFED